MLEWLSKKILSPLKAQLTQGATPHQLALSCALGVSIGLIPILGSATVICVFVAVALRLNQVATQVANYSMAALQIVMVPVFVSWGRWIVGAPPVSIDPRELTARASADFVAFLGEFGVMGLQAILAWTLTIPFAAAAVYFLTRGVFVRWQSATGKTVE